MSLIEDVFTHYKESAGLESVEGPWLDQVPADKAKDYPHVVGRMLPTSGRVTGAFNGDRYEDLDIRFEAYTTSAEEAQEISDAIYDAFTEQRFALGEGKYLGRCRQTGRYVRYAGRDNTTEIWCAVYTCRLTVEN